MTEGPLRLRRNLFKQVRKLPTTNACRGAGKDDRCGLRHSPKRVRSRRGRTALGITAGDGGDGGGLGVDDRTLLRKQGFRQRPRTGWAPWLGLPAMEAVGF